MMKKVNLIDCNANLKEFAFLISHDLRPPLNNIKGYTRIIEDYIANEKSKLDISNLIERIYNNCNKIDQLFSSLLHSSMSLGNLNYKLFSIQEVVNEVKDNLSFLIEENHATIICQNNAFILGNQVQIGQVIQNLIQNAIKYKGTEDPVIKLTTVEEKENWVISVADNGIGIKEEYKDRIFETFFQIPNHVQKDGIGLGLAISKKIIEQNGGRIWVESEYQKGSIFKFTILKYRVKDSI